MDEGDEMYRAPRDNAIMEEVHRIISQVQQSGPGAKWCDPEFDADDKSLYIDPLNPPDYAQDIPVVEWRRPEEIFTSDTPCMMKSFEYPGDVKCGILND